MLSNCETCGVVAGKICKNMKTGKRKKTPHECRVDVVPSVTRSVSSGPVSVVQGLVSSYLTLTSEQRTRFSEIVRLLNERS